MLDFRILGPFEVVSEGKPLQLGGPRQRALLAILLLHRGQAVPSDRLIDLLWGERAPATAAKTLQAYVSHLRKAVGVDVLRTRGGGYALDVAAEQVDAERFASRVAEARAAAAGGDPGRARELLAAALEMWRGEPLTDLAYEPFAQSEVARLEEARISALEDRIDADLALGHQREVVGELEALVRRHPRRERLLGQLMLALYRSGRQADALDAYHRGRTALDAELGLEPGPQLRALEQQILDHDPAVGAPHAQAHEPAAGMYRRRPRAGALVGGGVIVAAAVVAAVAGLGGDGGSRSIRVAPNSLAGIDTASDRVVAQVGVGARPGAVTLASGSVWVANLDDRSVSRVDPASLQVRRTIPVGDAPTGIAATRGRVWVVSPRPGSTLVSLKRIDPRFDSIEPAPARIRNVELGGATSLAARGDVLWVAPSSGELSRLDPETGAARARIDPNAAPSGVALTRDAVWLTDPQAGNVSRVDATGLLTSLPVGRSPEAIAAGEGAVWVADRAGDAVARLDPDTGAVSTTIPVGRTPAGIAVGQGSVWVANSGDGTVSRIDPASREVTATIPVGGSPQGIAVTGDRAWVTVAAPAVAADRSPGDGGTLRINSVFDVDHMDPALAYNGLSWQLLAATCARLLRFPARQDLTGARLVPEVAQSLPAITAGGRTYTFTVRRGFRFSPPSNEPVTAATFKASIERSLHRRMRSPLAAQYSDIVGAKEYMAGRAAHIAGVTARGGRLTVRLVAPAPDLPARMAMSPFCAVPPDTPIDPSGVRLVPSAGPYRIASYAPKQGIVLTRNPNYTGSRPRRAARIEVAVDVPATRATAEVEAGEADYAVDGAVTGRAQHARLATRYGPSSPAARRGRQQYFISAQAQVDFLALNARRPLFADARMRRAVSHAIDRRALARTGTQFSALPSVPASSYLPPSVPGYRNAGVFSLSPDLAAARRAAGGSAPRSAVLYTCTKRPCAQQAEILKRNLAKIGLRLTVESFSISGLYGRLADPKAPFDLAYIGWLADYPDPAGFLDPLLVGGAVSPAFGDPGDRERLAAARRLTGAERYLSYARLATDLARDSAPLVAFAHASSYELFSARTGCQTRAFDGIDLAGLCIRR